MGIRIIAVTPGSPADLAGIRPEEQIVSIGNEPVLDEIDYQALSVSGRLTVEISNGTDSRILQIRKKEWEPLGLCLDETEAMKPRHCQNRCLFCFVDQLPKGMRETLYVKDDDWRLSLMMGNYVTLTNVSDIEFDRIIARRASPLYISVHATDPEVRCRMLRNPKAGNLMERLVRLRDNGLEFHCQVVLCPDINDGDVLLRTIRDLAGLFPAARSLAIVPVGLTRFREGLPRLRLFNAASAAELLDIAKPLQERYLKELGTRFLFPSDEFYCLSGREIPRNEEYEDYLQIENGVGLLRQLENECREAFEDMDLSQRPSSAAGRTLLIPTGVSAYPFFCDLISRYAPKDTKVRIVPVVNRYFGETITVTGLIVGADLIHTLDGIDCDEILLCDTMLRAHTDSFLDDITLDNVRKRLNRPVRVMRSDGESLLRALWGMEEYNG